MSPAALQHRWTTHLAATKGVAARRPIDTDAAIQTVSDAQWAPILQDAEQGGPTGRRRRIKKAVEKYGSAPGAAYATYFLSSWMSTRSKHSNI